MTECKHIVGFADWGYEGLSLLCGYDDAQATDTTLFAFCPNCGVNLIGDMITHVTKDKAHITVITRNANG